MSSQQKWGFFHGWKSCRAGDLGCDLASEQAEETTSPLWVTSAEMTSLEEGFEQVNTHILAGVGVLVSMETQRLCFALGMFSANPE